MRLRFISLLAGLAISGCGDGETKTVTVSEEDSGTTTQAAELPECKKDIFAGSNEGKCEKDGTEFVVANRGNLLRLKELDARVERVQKRTSLNDGVDKPDGTYVLVSVAITNRTNEPQEFGGISGEPTVLFVDENRYSRAKESEIGLEGSFVMEDEIQPDGTKRGKLVFDLPTSAVAKLDSKAALGIINFTDADAEDADQVGFIKLYE